MARVPAKEPRPRQTGRGAYGKKGSEVENKPVPSVVPDVTGLNRVDGISPRQKACDSLGPRGQHGERHAHAAYHDERKEHALAQRLHGGDIIGERRDQEPQAKEGKSREGKTGRKKRGVFRKGCSISQAGEQDLQGRRGSDEHEAGRQGAGDNGNRRTREKAKAAPEAPFALGDHGCRHAEACAAEDAYGDKLTHLMEKRGNSAPKDGPEGDDKKKRHGKPVDKRLLAGEIEA